MGAAVDSCLGAGLPTSDLHHHARSHTCDEHPPFTNTPSSADLSGDGLTSIYHTRERLDTSSGVDTCLAKPCVDSCLAIQSNARSHMGSVHSLSADVSCVSQIQPDRLAPARSDWLRSMARSDTPDTFHCGISDVESVREASHHMSSYVDSVVSSGRADLPPVSMDVTLASDVPINNN